MKHSKLINKLTLGAACLLGMSGAVTALSLLAQQNNQPIVKANALNNGELYVGGVDINAASGKRVNSNTGNGGYALLNGNTLTLNNYEYLNDTGYEWTVTGTSSKIYAGILYLGNSNLTIVVEGINRVEISTDYCYSSYGFCSHVNGSETSSGLRKTAAITFSGTGKLTLKGSRGQSSSGLAMEHGEAQSGQNAGSLTINGPELYLYGGEAYNYTSSGYSNGQYCDSYLTLQDGALYAYGGQGSNTCYGLDGVERFTMNGGRLYAEGGHSNSWFSAGISFVNSYATKTFNAGIIEAYGGTNGTDNARTSGVYGGDFVVGENVTMMRIKGIDRAFRNSNVKNSIGGYTWTNVEGTQGMATIEADTSSHTYNDSIKNLMFGGIKYSISDVEVDYDEEAHTIEPNITTPDCVITYGTTSGVYNLDEPPAYTDASVNTIYWKIVHTPGLFPTVTGSSTVTINKANPVYSAPTAKTNLKYTGEEQALVNAGSVTSGGTMKYKLSTEEESAYSVNVPTATEPGTYSVNWKIEGDSNHKSVSQQTISNIVLGKANITNVSLTIHDEPHVYNGNAQSPLDYDTSAETVDDYPYSFSYSSAQAGPYTGEMPSFVDAGDHNIYFKVTAEKHEDYYGSVVFTIVKASSAYKNEPTAITGLKYTGVAQALVNAGSSDDGVVKYSLTETGEYSEDIPSVTNVGTYTVYYKIIGDNNHYDSAVKSLTAKISENDKTALVAAIAEAEAFYNSISTTHPTVAATLKTAIDVAKAVNSNPNVTVKQIADAVDALNAAIAKAKDDSRNIIIDDNDGVTIETKDGSGIPTSVDLRVEVRTDVKAEEGSVAREKIEAMLEGRDQISGVYDVKLIQTIDGVEKEIQPSDIEEGLKIIVHITLPEDIDAETLKVLHIHSEDDMEYITDFKVENGELIFEVDRFSEFAFVTPGSGLPGWAIVLIVLGSLLLLCALFLIVMFIFFPRYIIDYSKKKVIRTIYVKKEHNMFLLLDTHLRKVRRHEVDVYLNRAEAEEALKNR